MPTLNTLLVALPPEQQGDFYLRCAYQVLEHYDLGWLTPYFIQHNAGVVFRLDDSAGQPIAGNPFKLPRHLHRAEHREEIEKVLKT